MGRLHGMYLCNNQAAWDVFMCVVLQPASRWSVFGILPWIWFSSALFL